MHTRTLTFSREVIDTAARTVELAFSSEKPVLRFDGWEILSHDVGCFDFTRLNNGAQLLFNHDRDHYIGAVVPGTARVGADRVGRATVKICQGEDGDKLLRDIQDGILTQVSFGYHIDERVKCDPINGEPAYKATRWTPLEVSLVTIPADETVGVGRAQSEQSPETLIIQNLWKTLLT